MPMLLTWNELAQQTTNATVTKRRLQGAGADLVHMTIKAGTVSDRHSHAFEQFVQVISGCGMLQTDEGEKPFAAGSLFHFPAEAWHAARFDEDTVLVETNLVTP